MNTQIKASYIVAILILLQGCASAPVVEEDMAPTYKPAMIRAPEVDGGIFDAGREVRLFEDIKARRIGDILTVMLVEQNSGQNSADSNLSNSTGMNVETPTFGGRSRPNMGIELNSGHTFTGESGSSQSNRLTGSVTVSVVDVLPGGNLLVQGEKWIQINKGREYIKLSGVVRDRDVASDNVVMSTQVADARITYSGTGDQSRSNEPGWAAKILFSPIWPF